MSSILVTFWSGSGNTEKMAELIVKGIQFEGKNVTLKTLDKISVASIESYDVLVLGCPSMGSEELEQSIVEPFMQELEAQVAGRKIALFGSYGWGDGEWMRKWETRLLELGVELIGGAGLIVNETPMGDDIERCIAFGSLIGKSR